MQHGLEEQSAREALRWRLMNRVEDASRNLACGKCNARFANRINPRLNHSLHATQALGWTLVQWRAKHRRNSLFLNSAYAEQIGNHLFAQCKAC
jgi:hypothetical protein